MGPHPDNGLALCPSASLQGQKVVHYWSKWITSNTSCKLLKEICDLRSSSVNIIVILYYQNLIFSKMLFQILHVSDPLSNSFFFPWNSRCCGETSKNISALLFRNYCIFKWTWLKFLYNFVHTSKRETAVGAKGKPNCLERIKIVKVIPTLQLLTAVNWCCVRKC